MRVGAAAARGRAARRRWSPRRARYDPIQHPVAAKRRRDLVLLRMLEQGYLTRAHLREAQGRAAADPRRPDAPRRRTRSTRTSPPGSSSRSSTSSAAASRAPSGRSRAGCRSRRRSTRGCRTPPQKRDQATGCRTGPGPRAVARGDLQQGRQVRAMVGGDNYGDRAVQPRHPGPAPARLLVQAVRARRGAASRASRPQSTWASKKQTYILKGGEKFTVNNYDDAYAGRDARSRTRRRSPTTPSSPRSAGKVGTQEGRQARAPDGHPHAGLAPTSRSRSAACARASRRSTWRTPTRPSPAAAS